MKKYMIPGFLFFLLACGRQEAPRSAVAGFQPTRTVVVEKATLMTEVAGTVRAADVANLASRSPGFVRRVQAAAGQKVQKGDLLVLMDDRSLDAQTSKLEAAKAEADQAVREARHQLESAEAQKELASNTFERIRSLYEKKSASLQEFEEAQSKTKAAEAGWQAAEERLSQIESRSRQVDAERADLSAASEYIRVVAPFSGIVTSVPAQQGAFVGSGQTLVSLENPSRYQFFFSVEGALLSAVSKTNRLKVRISTIGEQPVAATIAEVSPSLDANTRTFQIKADLESHPQLRSGLAGTISLEQPGLSTLWIPAEFLSSKNDVETVVVQQGSDWRRILVKSGRKDDGKVEILSGLNGGETIGLLEGDP